jgi:hypothetical protein
LEGRPEWTEHTDKPEDTEDVNRLKIVYVEFVSNFRGETRHDDDKVEPV